jgi:hypothetical protein
MLMLAAPLAQAQNFESFYGEKKTLDGGQDVKAVNHCRGGGSIIVGSRYSNDDDSARNSEVLATRVDDNGLALWQRAYRIAGSKVSTANAVVEYADGKGFALTGSVALDPGRYIYVMQINCEGKPVWTTLLANQKAEFVAAGYDIIQAGTLISGGAAPERGELIVVGDEVADYGFGRIIRLTTSGTVIWDHAYSHAEQPIGLRFRAVTENLAQTGGLTDIVVAGSTSSAREWDYDRRSLMFRVDAAGTPVCNTTLGTYHENTDFFGLTPLLSRDYFGETVLVGATTKGEQLSLAYLVSFEKTYCKPRVQSIWVDPRKDDVIAYDAVEALGRDAGPGTIAVTGTISGSVQEGFLIAAKPRDLLEDLPTGSRRFGWRADRDGPENLFAIDLKSDRFVLAGSTFADWEGVGDKQDFYLVQTDPAMNTSCSIKWEPKVSPAELPLDKIPPRVAKITKSTRIDTIEIEAKDEGYCCEKDPPSDECLGVIDNGVVQLGVSKTGYLNVECPNNTVSSGRYGTTLVGLRYMPTNGDASAPGAPCEGWGVASADLGITGYTSRCAGTSNVTLVSFASTPSSAISTVDVGNTFRVTHQYNPTPMTAYLYQVDVRIENIGSTDVTDLRYSRGVDYDIAPNAFSEYITISGTVPPYVLASYANGFNLPDPLASHSGVPGDFTDLGPGDLGAHFDFVFGSLKVGEVKSFVTYYGAAKDEASALAALATVGASTYSLGQSDWDGSLCFLPPTCPTGATPGTWGAATGLPATFMYGFLPRVWSGN